MPWTTTPRSSMSCSIQPATSARGGTTPSLATPSSPHRGVRGVPVEDLAIRLATADDAVGGAGVAGAGVQIRRLLHFDRPARAHCPGGGMLQVTAVRSAA